MSFLSFFCFFPSPFHIQKCIRYSDGMIHTASKTIEFGVAREILKLPWKKMWKKFLCKGRRGSKNECLGSRPQHFIEILGTFNFWFEYNFDNDSVYMRHVICAKRSKWVRLHVCVLVTICGSVHTQSVYTMHVHCASMVSIVFVNFILVIKAAQAASYFGSTYIRFSIYSRKNVHSIHFHSIRCLWFSIILFSRWSIH